MNAAQQFIDEVLDAFAALTSGWDSTPSVLAAVAASVLPMDGAGISLIDDALRVPLGASTAEVSLAEQLQATLGDGPCLDAAAARAPVVIDASTMASRYPVYAVQLAAYTPFRSVAAVPLQDRSGRVFGALDLYSREPVPRPDFDPSTAASVGAELSGFLTGEVPGLGGDVDENLEGWLGVDPAVDRIKVWTAVGMDMTEFDEPDSAALSRLRGYAFANNLTLDELARSVVDRGVPLRDLHA